jgi:hypothetical protein
MSITITGGITLASGGWTITAAPPAVATAGWFGGGYGSSAVSLIDRIIFATDTATASVRGPLSQNTLESAGSGTLNNGWFGGGNPGFSCTVQRITYATDTATASVRGPLNAGRYQSGSTSDGSTSSWVSGGRLANSPTSADTQVSRITYATDTATASVRGPLSTFVRGQFATGTSAYGWNAGGTYQGGITTVQRIDYANDSATASVRGPLSATQYSGAAVTDSIYGWFAGGFRSTIQRIVYATDTDTATTRGPLPQRTLKLGASCDNTYGWFGGGYVLSPNANISTITRLTYANDTATTTDRGFLSLARKGLAGVSGVQ